MFLAFVALHGQQELVMLLFLDAWDIFYISLWGRACRRHLEKGFGKREVIRQTFCPSHSNRTNQITASALHFTASCWCEGATLDTHRYPVSGCDALGCFTKPAKRAQEKMNALMENLRWKKQLTREDLMRYCNPTIRSTITATPCAQSCAHWHLLFKCT